MAYDSRTPILSSSESPDLSSPPLSTDADDQDQPSGDTGLFAFNSESASLGFDPPNTLHTFPFGDVFYHDLGSSGAAKSNDTGSLSYYPDGGWAPTQPTAAPYGRPPYAQGHGQHVVRHNVPQQHQHIDYNPLWNLDPTTLVPGPSLEYRPRSSGPSPPLHHHHHNNNNNNVAAVGPSNPALSVGAGGGAVGPSPHLSAKAPRRRARAPLAVTTRQSLGPAWDTGSASPPGHQSSASPAENQQAPFRCDPGAQAHQPLHILTPYRQAVDMSFQSQSHSPKSEPTPDSSPSESYNKLSGGAVSSPEAGGASLAQGTKAGNKRKAPTVTDAEDDDDDEDENGRPFKKTTHNLIEKRYRNKLNDKIAILRDSVPSLRIMTKSARGEDTTEDREELHGLTPAHKLNKATILGKATEYIHHLEKRTSRLTEENATMRARIAAFEKLMVNGMTGVGSAQPPTHMQYHADNMSFMATPLGGPPGRDNGQADGMMSQQLQAQQYAHARLQQPLDASAARARNQQMIQKQHQLQQQQQQQQQQQRQQQHQQRQQQQQQQQQPPGGSWLGGSLFGKTMVGSIAGLMVLEAARENEPGAGTTDGRGLFALPIQVLRLLHDSMHVHFMGHHIPAHTVVHYLKLVSFLGLFLWMFVPAFFTSPKPPSSPKTATLAAAPSLASPIHVRRQAWLTAIQTVWVPHNNFVLEAAALGLKTLKLSLRNSIGFGRYQSLTGLTEEQEAARVKAWSIALDAQLAGGDSEINKSRLTLTLLASKTLPDTPQRLMMQALHIRVLLWDLARLGAVNTVAAKLARSHWNEARHLKRLLTQIRRINPQQQQHQSEDELLPAHLAALLEQECDIVLNDVIIQRAHNLAWNQPTDLDARVPIDGLNAVVDDTTVRSPLDAVAAWWSCQTVHNALTTSLEASPDDEEAKQAIFDNIDVAIRAAPIGCAAQTRALVARAVVVTKGRTQSIITVLKAFGGPPRSMPPALKTSADSPSTHELRVALRCAMALAHLNRLKPSATADTATLQILNTIPIYGQTPVSLLVWTAAYHLTEKLFDQRGDCEVSHRHVERLAVGLRVWVGARPGDKSVFDPELRTELVHRVLDIAKRVMGFKVDGGHSSASDDAEESESEAGEDTNDDDSSGWGEDEEEEVQGEPSDKSDLDGQPVEEGSAPVSAH